MHAQRAASVEGQLLQHGVALSLGSARIALAPLVPGTGLPDPTGPAGRPLVLEAAPAAKRERQRAAPQEARLGGGLSRVGDRPPPVRATPRGRRGRRGAAGGHARRRARGRAGPGGGGGWPPGFVPPALRRFNRGRLARATPPAPRRAARPACPPA